MEDASTFFHLSKSITVLDAIFWIMSSAREVTPQTVRNCFYKAGFRRTDSVIPPIVDNEPIDELNSLMRETIGEINEDYWAIDESVVTDDNSTDIATIVETLEENRRSEEEIEEEFDEEQQQVNEYVKFPEALQCSKKLKDFFLYHEDALGVKMAADIQMIIESKHSKAKRRQTTVNQFFPSCSNNKNDI